MLCTCVPAVVARVLETRHGSGPDTARSGGKGPVGLRAACPLRAVAQVWACPMRDRSVQRRFNRGGAGRCPRRRRLPVRIAIRPVVAQDRLLTACHLCAKRCIHRSRTRHGGVVPLLPFSRESGDPAAASSSGYRIGRPQRAGAWGDRCAR